MIMKKIPSKYFQFTFVSLMAFFMSALMTVVVTLVDCGFNGDLISRSLSAFKFSFPVAFSVAHGVAPLVRRLTSLFVEGP